jgi:hypothetical protein
MMHCNDGGVPSKPVPAIIDVWAGLGEVKAALLGLGATAPEQRSVAFELDGHLLLLAYDELDKSTTIAVGGSGAADLAHWLTHELEDAGHPIRDVLPPLPAT